MKKIDESLLPKGRIKFWERDAIALVEYRVRHILGRRVDQKHLDAFLSHDGVWIDIHLSKADFKPAEAARFESIVRSVRIVEGTSSLRPLRLADGGTLELRVPLDWTDTVKTADGDSDPSIQISRESGEPFVVIVTPTPRAPSDPGSTPRIRDILEALGLVAREFVAELPEPTELEEIRDADRIGLKSSTSVPERWSDGIGQAATKRAASWCPSSSRRPTGPRMPAHVAMTIGPEYGMP